MAVPYVEGRTINLTVDWAARHSRIRCGQLPVKIRTVYQPITMSPVMEVLLISEAGEMVAILKLFDRRFGIDFRRGRGQWTQEAEAAWQDYVCEGKAPALFRHLEEKELRESAGIFEDSSTSTSTSSRDSPKTESKPRPPMATKERLARTEGLLQRTALRQFATEAMAYQKMSVLQGRCVPFLLAHVSVSLPNLGGEGDNQEYFKVPGILLQYLDGFNLSTELTAEVPEEAWESVVQHALDAARMVNSCGVINLDCQPRNVVVQRSSLQPYLVDFAQCAFREDYKDDDEFAYYANSTDNQGAIGAVMTRKLKKENGVELMIRYEEMKCDFNPEDHRASIPHPL